MDRRAPSRRYHHRLSSKRVQKKQNRFTFWSSSFHFHVFIRGGEKRRALLGGKKQKIKEENFKERALLLPKTQRGLRLRKISAWIRRGAA